MGRSMQEFSVHFDKVARMVVLRALLMGLGIAVLATVLIWLVIAMYGGTLSTISYQLPNKRSSRNIPVTLPV